MNRLDKLIEKAASCSRYLNTQEEDELKTLHEARMRELSSGHEWDIVELKKMRYEKA